MLERIQETLFGHLRRLQAFEEKAYPEGLIRSRASLAGKCSRAIGLSISGHPASNEISGESLLNFKIGGFIHDLVQDAMLGAYPDAAQEEVELELEDFLTAHADLVYSAEDGGLIVCEIKSVADFAFMKATGIPLKSNGRWFKKDEPAEGPKLEHKLQAGIYAHILTAPYIAIIYVRKTATKDEAVCFEWRFKTEYLMPQILAEVKRHKEIVDKVRNFVIPAREYEGKIIEKPKETRWPCQYCQHLDSCVALGPGEIQIV